jgi:hypothetical protein
MSLPVIVDSPTLRILPVGDLVEQLRALIRDAENIQRMAQRLLDELNERLGNSVGRPNSQDQHLERRHQPRR